MSTEMKYDLKYITDMYDSGERMKFLFFWGHTQRGSEVTKACFSQWYPCGFEAGGVSYYTAEQYMMAQKALLFKDEDIFAKIMEAGHPKQFKDLGRRIRDFSQDIWDEHKFQIVVDGNFAKFSQNKELKEFLLQTGGRILAEASPYDRIWGIGMSSDSEGIENPHTWQGRNLLGFALMEVRDMLGKGD